MKSLTLNLWICLLFLSLYGCDRVAIPNDVKDQIDLLPSKIDYNFQVKKILSDKCFSCHGPDAKKQKASLRLDISEAAYQHKGESGYKAISPGNINKSDLVRRILSMDPDYQMPSRDSHLSLTNYEKAVLIKWVKDGAKYKPHWAYVAPGKSEIPKVKNKNWVKNEIDNFILEKIESENLQPAQKADKEILIRRLSFDIRGIGPSLQEIDEFVKDNSSNSYEKLVDRFLASDHYGERMAAYWLDVSRFADSYGYLDDKHYDQSPWRTWVINAYNNNLPFDKFITWQLAGDLLPNATQDQILATGFNRNHKQNTEAGIIEEEFRVEYVTDRTNTLGTALMATTIGCAKCHDHKYDPISQKDYYSLFSFFNSTFEKGSPNYGNEDMVAGPTLLLSKKEEADKIANIKKYINQLENEIPPIDSKKLVENKLQDDNAAAASLGKITLAKLSFDKKTKTPQGEDYFTNEADNRNNAKFKNIEIGEGVKGKSLKYNDETHVSFLPYKFAYFERYQPFSFSFWLKLPEQYEIATVFYQSDFHKYGYQGYDLLLKNNQLNFRLNHAFPHDALSVFSTEMLKKNEWYHVAISYDGSSRASGIQMYLNGKKQTTKIEYDHLIKHIRSFPSIHKAPLSGFNFGVRTLDRSMPGGELDEFYLFNNVLDQQQVSLLFNKMQFPISKDKLEFEKQDFKLYNARKELCDLLDTIKEVMVMGDLPNPRPTFVLNRGLYSSQGDRVYPNTPNSISPFPGNFPKSRLGLANWFFLPNHPLTSRVAVNRIWEMIFDRGIVKTSDDFGNQGAIPTHPELLDFLAVWFREKGWDTKALQKFIFMSATYQQSVINSSETILKDPKNIYLSRSPRYRYPAEMIRDNALFISNLLVHKIGGASTYPYQPAGLWDELSDKAWRYHYLQLNGEGLYRKSIYTIRKRTSVVPFMQIFDASDRSVCIVKRTVSSSPMQSLALLNDPQMIEASIHLGQRMMLEGGFKINDKLNFGFYLITGRQPNLKERNLLLEMYSSEMNLFITNPEKAQKILKFSQKETDKNSFKNLAAFAQVALALMNTDDFLTRK